MPVGITSPSDNVVSAWSRSAFPRRHWLRQSLHASTWLLPWLCGQLIAAQSGGFFFIWCICTIFKSSIYFKLKLHLFSMLEHAWEVWEGRIESCCSEGVYLHCHWKPSAFFSILTEETCHICDLSMIDSSTKSWHSGKFCVQRLFDWSWVPNESGAYVFVNAPIWPQQDDLLASEVDQ